jgi:hypothetical protein
MHNFSPFKSFDDKLSWVWILLQSQFLNSFEPQTETRKSHMVLKMSAPLITAEGG